MEFAIVGIGGAVLVGLIVQAIKLVFPALEGSRWLIPIALAVGMILSVLNHVAQIVPGFQEWFEVVIIGLVAGFTAMGMYDTTKAALKR